MPKELQNRIGEIITTPKGIVWKVIAEAERGWSYDRSNGVETRVQRTRRFELECQGCKTKREATYKNVFTSKNVVCFVCQNITPTEKVAKRQGSKLMKFNEDDNDRTLTKDGKVDGRSNRANSVEYVGRIFKCTFDTFICLEELDRVISKNGKNLYRNFLIECQDCHTQKEALSASLLSHGVACPKCRSEIRKVVVQPNLPLPDLERKIEILHEINDIWNDMKRMARAGILNEYLSKKYDIKITFEDEEPRQAEVVDDSVDIDYDNPDIDWDNEINNIL
jgi:hypothetical protein